MKKLKNGMKVKIKKSYKHEYISSFIKKVRNEQQTCIVINAHEELDRSKLPFKKHWVCDLWTNDNIKLVGFGIEELRRCIF